MVGLRRLNSGAKGASVPLEMFLKRVQFVDVVLCFLIIGRIIRVDLGSMMPGGIEPRHLLRLYTGIVFLSALTWNVRRISKTAWALLGCFFGYHVLVLVSAVAQGGNVDISGMYGAMWSVWLLLLLAWRGGDPWRLLLFVGTALTAVAMSAGFGFLTLLDPSRFLPVRLVLLGRPGDLDYAPRQMVGLQRTVHGFGYDLCFLVAASFVGFTIRGPLKARLWFGGLLILGSLGLFFNAERSAAFAVVLMAIFLLLIDNRTKSRRVLYYAGALLALLLVWRIGSQFDLRGGIGSTTIRTRMVEVGTFEADLAVRLRMQVAGLRAVLRSPFGNATGKTDAAYLAEIQRDPELNAYFSRHRRIPAPHNHFITAAYVAGWVSILLTTLMFASVWLATQRFRRGIRVVPNNIGASLYTVVTFSFWATVVNSLFHNSGFFFGSDICLVALGFVGAGSSILSRVRVRKRLGPAWIEPAVQSGLGDAREVEARPC